VNNGHKDNPADAAEIMALKTQLEALRKQNAELTQLVGALRQEILKLAYPEKPNTKQ
jgi:cell division protein FtsB